MEILREAPKTSSFIRLIDHQSSTPASFYTGPPVLHYHSDRSKLIVLEHEAQSVPALAPLLSHAQPQDPSTTTAETNGSSHQIPKTIPDLDIYVTSDKLLLFSTTANTGISIPYPCISLHAIQSLPQPSPEHQGLYMQVISQPADPTDDEEPDSLSLTLIPTAPAPPQLSSSARGTTTDTTPDEEEQTPVQALFNALSACSNLHPDPVDETEDSEMLGGQQSRLFASGLAIPGVSDGGLPPAMPGSGGWITAENMHEFVDEEGNWIGGDNEEMEDEEGEGDGEAESLGPGAGTVRQRDEEGETHKNGGDGEWDEDETKWRRTA